MSLKPPKKSDLGKSWMKNRRDKARMIQPEYHLIASEGTETEPQYFGAIQRIINSKYRDRIQLKVEGIGDNTVNLLMKARQYVQNNGIVFKHVWIVYDTDDFPAENIDMVAQLCEEYSAQGETIYHAVWSNQCVELWYLLHFMYMDTDIDRSRYWPKLSDCLKNMGAGSYEKNRPDMYEVLRPYMDIAIANAKRLDKQNEGRKPSESAPGTKVYELVEMLRPYLLDTQCFWRWKGGTRNMCDVLDKVENRGIAKGKIEGEMEGKAQVTTLMKKLFEQNRIDDAKKASEDAAYCDRLLKEFGIN